MVLNLRLRTISGGQDLEVENGTSIGELQALVAAQQRSAGQRYKLLLDEDALVSDFCSSGDTVVALPRRNLLPRPAPDTTPAPTSTDISTAIRAELARSGPAAVAEAEAAAAAATAALQHPQPQAAAPNAFAALAAALMGEADQVALEEALGSEGVAAMHAQLTALVRGMAAGEIGAGGGGDGGPPFDLAALAGLQMGDSEGEEDEEEGGLAEEDMEEEEDVYNNEESEDEEGMEGSSGREGGGGAPVLPEPDAAGLAALTEMGFSSGLAQNALLLNRNSFDGALEWIMEHAEDEAAAAPLSQERLASIYGGRRQRNGGHHGGSVAVDAEALTQLQDMGFSSVEASAALRMFGNAVEPAANWLLHMGPLRVVDTAAVGSAASGSGNSSGGAGDAAASPTAAAAAVAASEPGANQQQQQLMPEQHGGRPLPATLGSGGGSAAGRGSGGSGQEGSDRASSEASSDENS